MTLRRVPGFPNYRAEDRGLKAISLEPPMFRYMGRLGDQLAGDANAVGQSQYDALTTTIRMGQDNEPRASVEIFESKPHVNDARNEVLLRIIERAGKRGR